MPIVSGMLLHETISAAEAMLAFTDCLIRLLKQQSVHAAIEIGPVFTINQKPACMSMLPVHTYSMYDVNTILYIHT